MTAWFLPNVRTTPIETVATHPREEAFIRAALAAHLNNQVDLLFFTVVLFADKAVEIWSSIERNTAKGFDKQLKAYQKKVREIAQKEGVIRVQNMMRAIHENADMADVIGFSFTLQSPTHMPIAGIYSAKKNQQGQIVDFEVVQLLTEPERRETFGKIAFLFGKAKPFNPLSPFYIHFGPESAVPDCIEKGAIVHDAPKSVQ